MADDSTVPPEPTINRQPDPTGPPTYAFNPSGWDTSGRPGSRLGGAFEGRYELLVLLGRGGMGEVWRARDRALDRDVALKFLPFHLADRWEQVLLREARAAARLKHPNLVTLYDVVEADPPFLSMEFIDGLSLAQLCDRDGMMPIWQARDVVRQIAIGLQHIHENGLVHRDIKPANVMITAREQAVKILDLGIARLTPRQTVNASGQQSAADSPLVSVADSGAWVAPPADAPATGSERHAVGPTSGFQNVHIGDDVAVGGNVVGTPACMSPEQCRGEMADIRADIYGLGCTFYKLLTNQFPFQDRDVTEVLRSHTEDEPPPVQSLRSEVPRELANIIHKMLAKRPEDRFQTPIEVVRALDRFANPPPPPTPGTVTTADQFANVLKAERLLTPKQLDALDTDVLPAFQDLSPFAAELVARGWLTAFQVDEILKGQGKSLAVGGYVLTEPLGLGAFGRVYKAKQLLQGKEVAVKVIRPDLTKDEVAVARFRREIKLASALNHPNVATVFTADEEDGRLYMVMELCAGENLDTVVSTRHPVPWRDVCDWIAQAAAGLQHVHEKGLIHRDIKPANLMLTPTGVKILDLGLARVVSTDAAMSSASISVGGVIGTPHYISPEQANGDTDIDIRSDLYNLGGTMYHLLAGQPPYHGQNAARVFISQITIPAKPITDHRPEVPTAVAAVVHKLLAKAPAERFQTPAELLAALKDIP